MRSKEPPAKVVFETVEAQARNGSLLSRAYEEQRFALVSERKRLPTPWEFRVSTRNRRRNAYHHKIINSQEVAEAGEFSCSTRTRCEGHFSARTQFARLFILAPCTLNTDWFTDYL